MMSGTVTARVSMCLRLSVLQHYAELATLNKLHLQTFNQPFSYQLIHSSSFAA